MQTRARLIAEGSIAREPNADAGVVLEVKDTLCTRLATELTGGYLDDCDRPPWGTWIGLTDEGHFLAWVAEPFQEMIEEVTSHFPREDIVYCYWR